ncbi:hypothetical protein OG802_24230 [Streptomyces sp. NBC_00704]|uniref:hypothetical protein n=1 Tax=Streptomyces sp. NBC_00704 TaxID=2975809 RepID=UPI002E3084E5|nr:hypothetical protein [Streptomyces sp. NBC_00704]
MDHSLVALVNVINSANEDPGGPWLVLTTGGLVVSGQLIPNWLWFESYESEISAQDEDNAWTVYFSSIKDSIKEQFEEQRKAEVAAESLGVRYQQAILDVQDTAFIHLREAKVFSPGQKPMPANGMRWRGRLVDIAGWSFGKLGAD